MAQTSPMGGQKRDSVGDQVPFRSPAQDSAEGGNFVKLFVGCVPRTVQENDIRPLFSKQGNVLEVALVKDKRTGQQQGCCFIKYATIEEAERAIRALHNQYTLPGGIGPIQVRYADGERERLGTVENKLFVGSLNKQATEKEIEEIFAPYGYVDDVYILKDEQKLSKGCAFVKYTCREMAMEAINDLNGTYVMKGCDAPLIVQFAYPKRPRAGDRVGPAFGGPGFGPRPQGSVGIRSTPGPGRHIGGRGHGPSLNWRPTVARNMGSMSPQVAPPHHVNPLTPRAGSLPLGGSMAPHGGPVNGPNQASVSIPVQMGGPGMTPQQQGFRAPPAVWPTQAYGQQLPSQQPSQMQQQLPRPVPHEHQQLQQPPSYSQPQPSQQSLQQHGQLMQSTQPLTQQQVACSPLPASQQVLYGQLPVSQPQVQQPAAPALQHGPSVQQQHLSIHAIQQQAQPQSQQQPVLQSVQQQQSQMQTQQYPVLQPVQQHQSAAQSNYQLQQNLPLQQHPLAQIQSLQQQHLSMHSIGQQSQQQPVLQPLQQQQSQMQSQQHPVLQLVQQQQPPLQFHFQSQQTTPLQQQHRLSQVQSATQSQQPPLSTEAQQQLVQVSYQMASVEQPLQQQSSWTVPVPLQAAVTVASAPASVVPPTITASVVAAPVPAPVWTEHTSPEGHKYYYNSVTRESTWQKPEELTAFEHQKQQLLPQVQQAELQPQSQAKQLQPQPQPQQQEAQLHQHAMVTPYCGPSIVTHQQAIQGLPTGQDWMWKGRPAGS